ncbi:MAG TPA: acetoacetate decarboxylase family protein, partial [Anaeromyxobacter sp.]
MLRGFTPPFTPRGTASLVAPPPWHYAGWLLSVAFECDPARAAAFVPSAVGAATGAGTIHFADWQATTDGSELLDPVQAQYRETIVLLDVRRPDGTLANFCPLVYVDQDVSLLRGLLQGWPKKLGSTWITRALPLDHPAAAPLRAGTRLGASLAVKDRRLVEARLALTGRPGRALGFAARPTFGTVGWP